MCYGVQRGLDIYLCSQLVLEVDGIVKGVNLPWEPYLIRVLNPVTAGTK